jgi:hypothetical protein
MFEDLEGSSCDLIGVLLMYDDLEGNSCDLIGVFFRHSPRRTRKLKKTVTVIDVLFGIRTEHFQEIFSKETPHAFDNRRK